MNLSGTIQSVQRCISATFQARSYLMFILSNYKQREHKKTSILRFFFFHLITWSNNASRSSISVVSGAKRRKLSIFSLNLIESPSASSFPYTLTLLNNNWDHRPLSHLIIKSHMSNSSISMLSF